MMTNLKSKLEYNRRIDTYLRELRILTKGFVNKQELSSIAKVEEIRQKTLHLEKMPPSSFTIDFKDKQGRRFKEYVKKLSLVNSSGVYIWTHNTNFCGLYKAESIKNINFEFPFDLNGEGIIILLCTNLEDKLVLDFSIDADEKQSLQIDSHGNNWADIAY